jgi:hypothetical protein
MQEKTQTMANTQSGIHSQDKPSTIHVQPRLLTLGGREVKRQFPSSTGGRSAPGWNGVKGPEFDGLVGHRHCHRLPSSTPAARRSQSQRGSFSFSPARSTLSPGQPSAQTGKVATTSPLALPAFVGRSRLAASGLRVLEAHTIRIAILTFDV